MGKDDKTNDDDFLDGDLTPDRLFAAVGHALSCWEMMESELAALYTTLTGAPRTLDNLERYGLDFGVTSKRILAVKEAAEAYAVRNPNQDHEGEMRKLIARAFELSINRHRIAHGIIRGVPVMGAPDKDGWVSASYNKFTLGAPFYAVGSLRTNWLGVGSKIIDLWAKEFSQLASEFTVLNAAISPL